MTPGRQVQAQEHKGNKRTAIATDIAPCRDRRMSLYQCELPDTLQGPAKATRRNMHEKEPDRSGKDRDRQCRAESTATRKRAMTSHARAGLGDMKARTAKRAGQGRQDGHSRMLK